MVDTLATILQDLRLASSFYAHSELRAPWGIAFTQQDGPSFHIIISGKCWLRLDGALISLEAGDLALLPRGTAHQLVHPADAAALPLLALGSERIGENAAQCRFGGMGEEALLICGGIRFAGPVAHTLVANLPPILLLHHQELEPSQAWLTETLTLLGAEAYSLRQGSAAVMTRLADILVLQAIRAWLEANEAERLGWLGALSDREIGRALTLIHSRPEEVWTVPSLARAVHLSRSVFAGRFSRLVGIPPKEYVSRWRMQVAASWLGEEGLRPSEVAYRLGYSSEAAFSRAFRRQLQVPPGSFRRDRMSHSLSGSSGVVLDTTQARAHGISQGKAITGSPSADIQ
jgi:AraC-like DNA-binding protein